MTAIATAAAHSEILPFTLDGGLAARAAIGLIVLATDHTIEHEWRRMLDGDGIALYQTRLLNSPTIEPALLAEMEARIPEATALLLPGERLDVLAFGCTSGAMVIGEERVFDAIRTVRPGIACTTPITAAVAALDALGARRIGLITPYVASINALFSDYLAARGFDVPVVGTFDHGNDNEVARIDAGSVGRAVMAVGARADVDAVFVSCTSLRVAERVAGYERQLGKPVISSNHAMAWHALRLAGVGDARPEFGRLFTLPASGGRP